MINCKFKLVAILNDLSSNIFIECSGISGNTSETLALDAPSRKDPYIKISLTYRLNSQPYVMCRGACVAIKLFW